MRLICWWCSTAEGAPVLRRLAAREGVARTRGIEHRGTRGGAQVDRGEAEQRRAMVGSMEGLGGSENEEGIL